MRTAQRLSDTRVKHVKTARSLTAGYGGRAHHNGRIPATMPLGEVLFEYLYRRGVRHSFGVPGDFALLTFVHAAQLPGLYAVAARHRRSSDSARRDAGNSQAAIRSRHSRGRAR